MSCAPVVRRPPRACPHAPLAAGGPAGGSTRKLKRSCANSHLMTGGAGRSRSGRCSRDVNGTRRPADGPTLKPTLGRELAAGLARRPSWHLADLLGSQGPSRSFLSNGRGGSTQCLKPTFDAIAERDERVRLKATQSGRRLLEPAPDCDHATFVSATLDPERMGRLLALPVAARSIRVVTGSDSHERDCRARGEHDGLRCVWQTRLDLVKRHPPRLRLDRPKANEVVPAGREPGSPTPRDLPGGTERGVERGPRLREIA